MKTKKCKKSIQTKFINYGNNTLNGDIIYKIANNLHIPLPNLSISTYRNMGFILFATLTFSAIASFLLLKLFYKVVPSAIHNSIFPLDAFVFMGLIIALSGYGITKYLTVKKSDQWLIQYDDGKLTFKGKTFEFYKDIQDITYSAKKSSVSGELTLLIINHQTGIPYHQTISFEYAARAEYIEKAFKDPERKKAYIHRVSAKNS